MTDRTSNIEIEDVLSSIRKLVSDDLRPGAAVQARPVVPRLVLTAALRVPPDPVREAPASAGMVPEPMRLEDPMPTLTDAAPPELGKPGAGVSQDRVAVRLAELELLMAGQGGEFDEDGPAPVTMLRPVAPPQAVAATPEADAQAIWSDAAPQAFVAPDYGAAELAEAPYVADHDAQFVDAFDLADSAPERPESHADIHGGSADEASPLLDESVFRELIRDVLREELQGVMGERVTRNLRKLVRAEIGRALTARGIA